MQHWTLCKVLRIAQRYHSALNYIDAHAMAPLATCRTGQDPVFDAVRDGLPNGESAYEKAWHSLTRNKDGYPNSANFIRKVWKGRYSLFLCEKDPATYACITDWLRGLKAKYPDCVCATPRCGDWRCTFAEGLPRPADVGLPNDALTFISFDPNMYDRNGPPECPRPENMYPPDLTRSLKALQDIAGRVLLQVSTYSANNDNSQKDVIPHIGRLLAEGCFERVGKTRADGNMMSLIYARGVPWASSELTTLGQVFNAWLRPYS